jgi:hypothetical protein
MIVATKLSEVARKRHRCLPEQRKAAIEEKQELTIELKELF